MEALQVYRRSELEAISSGCMLRYKRIWIDGVDDSSDPALLGIGFAAIKHRYLVALVDNKVPQDADLAEAAYVAGVADAKTPSRLLPELHDLWRFHAEKFELPLEKYVVSEERGQTGQVGWAPDLVLAHAVENILEVVDDKSGWQPPVSEAEVRVLFQARVYARYARDRWPGFSRYRFTIHAVRFNTSTTVEFTNEELDRVDTEVAAAIAAIERAVAEDHWPAVPGPACHFCTLACPVADQQLTLPKRLTLQQFEALGGWLLVADKQLKAMKKLMKANVAEFGPCNVNGVVWDNRPVVSRAYPVRPVVNLMDRIAAVGGFDAVEGEGLTLSHSALKGLFKKFPRVESELQDVVKTKTSYRFGASDDAEEI